MHDLIWLRHFLFLATWPNKLTMTLIHWKPLELKPFFFLVLSILLNLKKKKTIFFPYLREKEGASGLCWDWLRNKVWGWVFPPQSYKNGKRKIIVDDRVLKWKMIVVWKRARIKKKERKKVRIVFETTLHNSFFLTISKTHKS